MKTYINRQASLKDKKVKRHTCCVFQQAYITHRQTDNRTFDKWTNKQMVKGQTDKTRKNKNGYKEFERELRDL